jgi:hypothetical protein
VLVDQPPAAWAFEHPPPGLVAVEALESADLIVAFVRAADELPRRLPALVRRIFPTGCLWVAWPRRAGGHESDLTDTVIRAAALPLGVVDVKVAAIDGDWSGLKFVWRLAERARPSVAAT